MSPEDTALCQQGIDLYNAGQKKEAYKIFGYLYDNGNDEDMTVLFWLAYTTTNIGEAELALETIERLEPDHPKLPELQRKIAKWQQREAHKPRYLEMICPYCDYVGPARIAKKISVGGWIWFAVFFLLFLCFLAVSLYLSYMLVPETLLEQVGQEISNMQNISFFFLLLSLIGLFIKKHFYTCGYCGIKLGDMH